MRNNNNMNNSNGSHHRRPKTALRRRLAMVKAALAAALVLLGMTTARAQAPIVIQFSHVVTADTAKGKAALRFKELAEARTQGRVRVEVYPNSQLYKDREELDALRLGAVQMIAPSLSKLGGLGGGEFGVFDLPFLFRDHAAFRAVVDGPVGANLLATLEPGGIRGLAYWDNGFKVFTANRPLHAVGDFRNTRIRIQASRVLVAQMEAMGALPSVSPLVNVYEALKSGQLDGQENVPVNITTQHLDEVQSHLIISNHGYLAYAVIVNKAFWGKLPPDIRSTLEGAMRDATAYANGLAEADNARALERLRSGGRLTVFTPSAQELAHWRTALAPVYQASARWIGSSTLAAVQAATGAPP
jgi:C4-dicarboxylate-binding protein DctP